MLKISESFCKGFELLWQNKKMLLYLFLFYFLFVYTASYPLKLILNSALENRTAADDLLQKFDLTLYSAIMSEYANGFKLISSISLFIVLWMALNIFFAGGIISVFIFQKPFRPDEFLSDCLTNFGSYLKLSGISLLYYLGTFLFFLILNMIFNVFVKGSPSEVWPITARLIAFGIWFLVILFVNMLFDYAKIIVIADDNRSGFAAVSSAAKFIKLKIVSASFIYITIFAAAVLAGFGWFVISESLAVNSAVMVFVYFILSQIFIALRLAIRLFFFSTQTSFFQGNKVAMPVLTREMMDMAVAEYENRAGSV